MVQAVDFIKEKSPKLYDQLLELEGVIDFQQIPDFKMYDAKNILKVNPIIVQHFIKHLKWNNRMQIYITDYYSQIRNIKTKEKHQIDCSKILSYLEEHMGYYAH